MNSEPVTVRGQGFEIRIGVTGDHEYGGDHLCLAIGDDCALVQKYNLYKDVMVVRKTPTKKASRGGAVFDRLPYRVETLWGIGHDGGLYKIANEFSQKEIMDNVQAIVNRLGYKQPKIKYSFLSVLQSGWLYYTNGHSGYRIIMQSGGFASIQLTQTPRKTPYTGTIALNHYGRVVVPVRDVIQKFINNLGSFSDPFAGAQDKADQVIEMEK